MITANAAARPGSRARWYGIVMAESMGATRIISPTANITTPTAHGRGDNTAGTTVSVSAQANASTAARLVLGGDVGRSTASSTASMAPWTISAAAMPAGRNTVQRRPRG